MSVVLGIESSCDETAVGVVVDGKHILSNVIYSQSDIHSEYGGVYPELACRRHCDVILDVIEKGLIAANISHEDIDLIAVATNPGLIGALMVGLNAAKGLAYAWKKPFIGVNHVEAHLYSAMMSQENNEFPSIGLVVSGGHTSLLKICEIGEYEYISGTIDDAIGEAFDKVARMLGLPYPGGPEVENLAITGDRTKYKFKQCKVKDNDLAFSFSGLKTQVLYAIKGKNQKHNDNIMDDSEKHNIAASFQEIALQDVVSKSMLALIKYNLKTLYIGGGVSNNKRLKEMFAENNKSNASIFFPQKGLSSDNGAMIAGLGYHIFKKNGKSHPFNLTTSPSLSF